MQYLVVRGVTTGRVEAGIGQMRELLGMGREIGKPTSLGQQLQPVAQRIQRLSSSHQLTLLGRRLLVVCGAVIVLTGIISLVYGVTIGRVKTGIEAGEKITRSEKRDRQGNILETVKTTTFEDAKTIWDGLSLLGVPVSLALLAAWLQQLQQKRADRQTRIEKEIAEVNQREEVLQAYIDRVSDLLVDKQLIAIATGTRLIRLGVSEEEVLNAGVDIIRARTLSILRRLGEDAERKTDVIQFLIDTEVIDKLRLNLSGANLGGADLSRADLRNVNLSRADLSRTNLSEADLSEADLSEADLSNANLSNANLSNANLSNANLSNANLDCANLRVADLSNANLSNANLRGTDFGSFYYELTEGIRIQRISIQQIQRAQNWQAACYDDHLRRELRLPVEEN